MATILRLGRMAACFILPLLLATEQAAGAGGPASGSLSCSSDLIDPPQGTNTPTQGSVGNTLPVDIALTNSATWKHFLLDVRHDQATIVKFPLGLAHGRHWEPALAIAAVTAGLIALDPHDTPTFRQTTAFHTFNHVASGVNTALVITAIPAAFYAISAKRGDSYGKQTVFLAAEAALDSQILDFGMKTITRRLRPIDVPSGGNYADTWFKAGFLDSKSFPSGHAITAFALADVFAERYANHRWVPWVAYSVASTIAFSRLTTQAHFPSDLFVGAVLGTLVSHYLVLRRHTTY